MPYWSMSKKRKRGKNLSSAISTIDNCPIVQPKSIQTTHSYFTMWKINNYYLGNLFKPYYYPTRNTVLHSWKSQVSSSLNPLTFMYFSLMLCFGYIAYTCEACKKKKKKKEKKRKINQAQSRSVKPLNHHQFHRVVTWFSQNTTDHKHSNVP